MDEKTFKTRTKKLAVAIIKEVDKLPHFLASEVPGRQLVRSSTSIGAKTVASIRTLRSRKHLHLRQVQVS